MSSAPDSAKMPYELADEEIRLYVAPLLGLRNRKPRNKKWLQRWALINSILVEFDGANPIIVKGYRPPFDAQVAIREIMPPELDGTMVRFIGSFKVRDTAFAITAVPPGSPPDSSKSLVDIVQTLLKLDAAFRAYWGERPIPEGIARTDTTLMSLKKVAERIGGKLGERIDAVMEELGKWPIVRLKDYPEGLIHGDPGVDNVTIGEAGVVFCDGPTEWGPELVDVAYLFQSAGVCIEDFSPEPAIEALAEHYSIPPGDFRRDLLVADAIAHINVIGWFDRYVTKLIPQFGELYDHLIEERVRALELLAATSV